MFLLRMVDGEIATRAMLLVMVAAEKLGCTLIVPTAIVAVMYRVPAKWESIWMANFAGSRLKDELVDCIGRVLIDKFKLIKSHPLTQCAAVKAHFWSINTAPQTC